MAEQTIYRFSQIVSLIDIWKRIFKNQLANRHNMIAASIEALKQWSIMAHQFDLIQSFSMVNEHLPVRCKKQLDTEFFTITCVHFNCYSTTAATNLSIYHPGFHNNTLRIKTVKQIHNYTMFLTIHSGGRQKIK